MTASTSPTSSGSSAEVGSSNSIMSGFMDSERAIATRCIWPPESWDGWASTLSESPTRSSMSRAICWASAGLRRSTFSCATVRLRSTVMCGNRLNCWNTMPIRVRMASRSTSGSRMSMPSMWMEPPVGRSSRFTERSRVDFPEPEGPMTHTTSPRSMVRSMPLSTSSSSKLLWSWRISMAGAFGSGVLRELVIGTSPSSSRAAPPGW